MTVMYQYIHEEGSVDLSMAELFNANNDQLSICKGQSKRGSITNTYARMMIAYDEGHREELVEIIKDQTLIGSKNIGSILLDITKLHLKIQDKMHSSKDVISFLNKQKANNVLVSTWAGEVFFVAGSAYSSIGKYQKSYELFKHSYEALIKINANLKAKRALLNCIKSLGNFNHKKSMVEEFIYLAEEAISQNEVNIASSAYLYLSHEFENFNNLDDADKYCQKSLNISNSDQDVIINYLTQLQMCNLNFKRGYINEGNILLEKFSSSSIEEISNCIKILKWMYKENKKPKISKNTPNSWAEKLKYNKNIKPC